GHAEAEFRLANGRQRHAKIFADEDVPETDDGKLSGNFDSLIQENVGRADGHEVVDGLQSGGIGPFVQHLQRGLFAFFNGAARIEHQFIVQFDVGFTEGAAKAIQPFLRPGGNLWSGEKGDAFVTQFQQMLRSAVTGLKVVGLHVNKLTAKWRRVAEDNGRNAATLQFLIDRRFRSQAVNR